MTTLGVNRLDTAYRLLPVGVLSSLIVMGLLVLALLLGSTGGIVPFALGLLFSVLPVPAYVAFLLWLDRHEKEPGWLLLAAFLWGSTVSILAAFVFNGMGQFLLQLLFGPQWALRVTMGLVAPVVEETAKAVGVLGIALLMRGEFDNLTDGLVYGALVGLGFGVAENVLYLGRAFAAGGFAGLAMLFLLRVLLLGLMHSVWTGCTGAGLGYGRERGGAARFVAPVAGYVCAIALHALWNSTNIGLDVAAGTGAGRLFLVPVTFGVLLLPPMAVLGVLAFVAGRREQQLIRTRLVDLVAAGWITQEELQAVATVSTKGRRLWEALARRGPGGWLTLRQYYDALAELAFVRWRLERGRPGGTPEETLKARIAELRSRLDSLGIAYT